MKIQLLKRTVKLRIDRHIIVIPREKDNMHNYLRLNFFKDHRNKIEVPDPLAVEDLISSKLNNKRKLARLITQYRDIYIYIFLNISLYCVISLANFRLLCTAISTGFGRAFKVKHFASFLRK